MKPEDSPYIVWFDGEMTGNRPDDVLIEVGVVLTDRNLVEIDSQSIALALPETYWPFMDPFVVAMHTKNGLLADCAKSEVETRDADAQLVAWIKKYTAGDHIPLAGSGVSHFDRRFIQKDLPKFDKYLSYWAYDVGTIRRTLKLFGIDASMADTTDDKTHRAIDDIRAHVEEMRRYKKMFLDMEQAAKLYVFDAISRVWPG